jgi:hypothetical protein
VAARTLGCTSPCVLLAATTQAAACLPLDVFQRGYVAGDPVDVDPLSNRAVDAVEPYLGLLAQPANLALETERLAAFFHHGHSSSVLLKVMLEQLRRSCL